MFLIKKKKKIKEKIKLQYLGAHTTIVYSEQKVFYL